MLILLILAGTALACSGGPDSVVSGEPAVVRGSVTLGTTPAADVVVQIAGLSAQTDANGEYIIEDVPQGLHEMTSSGPCSYYTATVLVRTPATVHDFELRPWAEGFSGYQSTDCP